MKYLALGPGAMGIFSILGAVYHLKDELKNVQEIAGASAGSLIGLFLSLDNAIDDLVRFLFECDISQFYNLKLKNFITKYGFIDIFEIKKLLKNFLKVDPTFKDLPKKFYVSVYNVNYERTEYFSVDTHPDMSVFDAVCISMSIPLMFTSTIIDGNYYSDGGIFEKVPLTPFMGKPDKEIMGIELDFLNVTNKKIKSIKDFLSFFYGKTIRCCSVGYDKKKFNIISVNQLEGINILNFKLQNDDKLKMFFDGYNTARLHSGLAI